MSRVYLALGSNLGDRQRFLDDAVRRLRAAPGLTVRRVSSYFETAPVGGPANAGAYLNAVAEADTILSPDRVLETLLFIERQFGRIRSEPNAPRTLDLDLILYDDLVRASPDPVVPHPRMHERRFVLEPLAELATDLMHPTLRKTIRELLAALPADASSKVYVSKAKSDGRELAGLRAFVAGSSSGIGRAVALELAEAGADLIVHGHRSHESVEAVAKELRLFGGNVESLVADIADPGECERLVADAWGDGLEIFVQCAGVDLLTTEAVDWPFDRKWEALSSVDVAGTMRLCRALGERMAARRGGSIVTIGWDQAETGFAGESGQLFGAAKSAVMAFTKSLARTLAPSVRVNCVAPGWIKTAWGESASESWQSRVASETPLARWGLPEDVAAAVRWLVSTGAAFITGQVVRVNGGVV